MAGISAWWRVGDPLREEERLLSRWPANHTQGRLARGGALILSETRLVFQPHRVDHLLRARCWQAVLGSIAAVDVAPRTGALFDGGLIERLRIHLHPGEVELFVVDTPSRVAAAVRAALLGPEEIR